MEKIYFRSKFEWGLNDLNIQNGGPGISKPSGWWFACTKGCGGLLGK